MATGTPHGCKPRSGSHNAPHGEFGRCFVDLSEAGGSPAAGRAALWDGFVDL